MDIDTTKITAGDIVSAVRKFSNRDDETRKFDISLEANIYQGKVTNINNGIVKGTGEDSTGSATFNLGEGFSYFGFSSNNYDAETIQEAVLAVVDFVQELKAIVNPIEN